MKQGGLDEEGWEEVETHGYDTTWEEDCFYAIKTLNSNLEKIYNLLKKI